ncbi:NEQ025 [Nanoarchaeum equitans Kin4-M]|uniref:NEQ025 n=1 Tax=Nanoarchaeum equitans (strain Kin4-M) TaxID=228908 RepID=Q74MH0_NANEQ|nr:NEQ025 [Nanoarchaeum equitans Kin4-M]
MKDLSVIILSGGFATRLKPLSEYIPKPLLPIGGVPIINYILQRVIELNPERIIISVNKKFENHFRYWLKTLENDKIELIVTPIKDVKELKGAIWDLNYSIKEAWINENLLVVAGDNLFDFNLRKLIRIMRENKSFALALYDVKNLELAKRYGVVKLKSNKIIDFKEKPEKPESTLVSTAIYAIPKEKLSLIDEYIENPNNEKDKLGKLIEWLLYTKNEPVYGIIYEGNWFDIGSLDEYIRANKFVEKTGWNNRFLWP